MSDRAVVSNCILTGNSATYGGGVSCSWDGVALSWGTLYNCALVGNTASIAGGGAYFGTLNHCTLSGNSASYGGGTSGSTLNHCTLSDNSAFGASAYGGGAQYSTLNHCTLSGNTAAVGAGAFSSTLNYCTLFDNSASYGGGGTFGGVLNHCLVSGNSASYDGGGAYQGALNYCVLTGNSAIRSGGGAWGRRPGGEGGDDYVCILNNCILSGNWASEDGGGAWGAMLNNCTLSANEAPEGGGVSYSALTNCIVYYNDAASGPNFLNSTFNYSCTTPHPGGIGNIANEPQFVDWGSGDFHLRPGSACIDAGNNTGAAGTTDLDGNPRIVNDVVDMGAFESLTMSIWANTAAPSVADAGPDSAAELGVKFRSDVPGTVIGIRFYKADANIGIHVGNLWTSNGTLLAAATFSNETDSGWQQALFATPVAIASNTVYVASYHANNGHYSADLNYFLGKGVDNPPMHVLMNGVFGGNGVYAYGASSLFPNQSYNAANYWVDVVFQSRDFTHTDLHPGDAGESQHLDRRLAAVHGDGNLLGWERAGYHQPGDMDLLSHGGGDD